MSRVLKVLTYNIHHGEGMKRDSPQFTGFADLEQIARIIRDTDADIVALQELDRWHPRSGCVDQPAVLGELLGMHVRFGCNVKWPDDGEYGVATLSRFPIRSWANTRLPGDNGLEPRGVLETSIDVPGVGDVTVLNTHLQYVGEDKESIAVGEREAQASAIAGRVSEITGPLVLMGDFNAEPGDAELTPLAGLQDAWDVAADEGDGRTIPGHPQLQPGKRIDIVYVNEAFRVLSAEVIRSGEAAFGSDHLPVVARLSV